MHNVSLKQLIYLSKKGRKKTEDEKSMYQLFQRP